MTQITQRSKLKKRKMSVRSKIKGTAKRPRLSVFRSNEHIYLQVINDEQGVTLVGAGDYGQDSKVKGTKTEKAVKVAKNLAKELKKKKIKRIVFDRGPYRYHGRIKAVAETLREEGLDF
jgi:large subunit ribosomal protein L18